MRLYKYCAFNGNKHLRANLRKSILYFQKPELLNDPFDVFPAAILNVNPPLNKRLSATLIKNIREHLSVCCFTTDPKNLLMWAHYADKHRGICLCFDFPDNESIILPAPHWSSAQQNANTSVTPQSVTYLKARPKMDLSAGNSLDKFFLIKYEAWGYEHEYRAFIKDDYGEFNYNSSYLTGIIAGCKMPAEDLAELRQLINELPSAAALYKTVPAHHAFRLDIARIR